MAKRQDRDLDYIIGVRLSAEQKAFVRRVSKATKQPMSRYIRDLVEMERQLQMTPCTYESFEGTTLWGRFKEWMINLKMAFLDLFIMED